MCWHVVRSLGSMAVWSIPGRNTAKKILQIKTNIRVGIFLNGE